MFITALTLETRGTIVAYAIPSVGRLSVEIQYQMREHH